MPATSGAIGGLQREASSWQQARQRAHKLCHDIVNLRNKSTYLTSNKVHAAVGTATLPTASLALLLAVGAWVWLVPQMPAAMVAGAAHNNLGHLAYPSEKLAAPLQLACQVILSLLSLGLVALCVGVVAWAWVHRSAMPRKTLFPDVMPVGDRVAFTPSFDSPSSVR
jgi:hypothetical protein